jgi:hypothetical protein
MSPTNKDGNTAIAKITMTNHCRGHSAIPTSN